MAQTKIRTAPHAALALTAAIAAAAILAAAPGAASQPANLTATQRATQPAATRPQPASVPAASAPIRSPEEEARIAIDLVNRGRIKEGLRLAEAAYNRASKPGLPLFARAKALDADGKSYEAADYASRYIQTQRGSIDWRGHALLGSIYVRVKSYRLAMSRLEEADRLFDSTAVERGYLLADKAEAMSGTGDKKGARTLLTNLTAGQGLAFAGDEAVKKEPEIWLAFAKVLYESGNVQREYLDFAWKAAFVEATKYTRERLARSTPDDLKNWRLLSKCYDVARQIRDGELQGIFERQYSKPFPEDAPRRGMVTRDLARALAEKADADRQVQMIEALDKARVAVEYEPTRVEFQQTVAELEMKIGDFAAAKKTLDRVLQQKPDDQEAQKLLATVMRLSAPPPPSTTQAASP